MSKTYLLPHSGKGKELQELLRRELGVPATCTHFSVHFAKADVVRVDCSYLPVVDNTTTTDTTLMGDSYTQHTRLDDA